MNAHMILSLYYRRWESHRIFWISFNLKGENMSSFVLKSILIKNYHGMSGSFKIVDNIMPYTSNIMLSAIQVLLSTYFKAFSTYIPDKYTIKLKTKDAMAGETSTFPCKVIGIILFNDQQFEIGQELSENGRVKFIGVKELSNIISVWETKFSKADNSDRDILFPVMLYCNPASYKVPKKIREKGVYHRFIGYKDYATFWIRQAALRGIHDKGYMIRIPIHYQEKQYQLYQTKEKLIKELHREPTLKEISSDTGISEKLLKEYEAQQGIRIVGSLDAPINLEKEESETFGDFIADTDQNIEEIAEQKELEELILQCLDNLTDKEKSVIKMRFGFNGEEPMTLEAVGNQLGVTRERIRQIEAKSIRKLRNYKTRLLLEDYIPKK